MTRSERIALWSGVAVPFLYYGTQFIAMPFYPGYRFVAQVASELGSPGSTSPVIFNAGSVLTGVAALIASYGFLRVLGEWASRPQGRSVSLRPDLRAGRAEDAARKAAPPDVLPPQWQQRVVSWLVFLAMLSNGAAGIWAGVHPLPDPRHNPGAIGVGMFFLPLLFILAMWRYRSKCLRTYLIANCVLYLILAPIMSGSTGISIDDYRGILQRVAALVMYVPIGVVAAFLLRVSR